MSERILPEFQDFLMAGNIVSDKYVTYYAYWVSRFLVFVNSNQEMKLRDRMNTFLEKLRINDKKAEWQVQQAETAINVYLNNFLDGDVSQFYPERTKQKDNLKMRHEFKDMVCRMRDSLRVRHYAYRTEQSYLDWVKRFYQYLEKTNGTMDSKGVKDFLTYLALNRNVAASTQNQAFNALLFLFRNVLDKDLGDLSKTVRAKRGPKLPVVLSVDEVESVFKILEGTNLLMLQLLYGAGLRLMELVRLRVKDIDFFPKLIIVRTGKGDKDRSTMLPEAVKTDLYLHLERVRSLHEEDLRAGYGEVYMPTALSRKYPHAAKEWGWQYVFPSKKLSVDPRGGKVRRHHISEKAIQDAMKKAVRDAGIVKQASVHTMRHSFATHLLMSGVNIRKIQDYLGHKNVETTMIYTHVVRDMSADAESPLDTLKKKSRGMDI